MLNLTRLHLGIAHESQFQGLGIRRTIADKLIALARTGERNPDVLCDKALEDICRPAHDLEKPSTGTVGRSPVSLASSAPAARPEPADQQSLRGADRKSGVEGRG